MMLIAILKATIYHLSKNLSVYCDFADQSEVGAKSVSILTYFCDFYYY